MKISVAFIVYNGSQYLLTQIDSILDQTLNVNEIIVYDDASSDNTKEILDEYKNKHPNLFFIHYNNQNIGPTKNIEKAIQACTGELILLADQDDYWEAHKVETIVKWFEQNPTMNGVFTNGSLMNSKEELDNKYSLWDAMSFPYKTIKSKNELNNNLKLYINTVENCITGATLAFRNNLPWGVEYRPYFRGFPNKKVCQGSRIKFAARFGFDSTVSISALSSSVITSSASMVMTQSCLQYARARFR